MTLPTIKVEVVFALPGRQVLARKAALPGRAAPGPQAQHPVAVDLEPRRPVAVSPSQEDRGREAERGGQGKPFAAADPTSRRPRTDSS